MARETIASVKTQLEAAIAERDRANDRAGEYRREQEGTEKAFIAREAKLKTEVRQLTEEGNQLRGMIRNLETELARRAGYMEAIEDAKPKPPPRMIPAPEPEHYAEAARGSDGFLEFDDPTSNQRYGRERVRKGWWER